MVRKLVASTFLIVEAKGCLCYPCDVRNNLAVKYSTIFYHIFMCVHIILADSTEAPVARVVQLSCMMWTRVLVSTLMLLLSSAPPLPASCSETAGASAKHGASSGNSEVCHVAATLAFKSNKWATNRQVATSPRHSLGFTQTVNLTPSQHACAEGRKITSRIKLRL